MGTTWIPAALAVQEDLHAFICIGDLQHDLFMVGKLDARFVADDARELLVRIAVALECVDLFCVLEVRIVDAPCDALGKVRKSDLLARRSDWLGKRVFVNPVEDQDEALGWFEFHEDIRTVFDFFVLDFLNGIVPCIVGIDVALL